jgi:hypothetical protein
MKAKFFYNTEIHSRWSISFWKGKKRRKEKRERKEKEKENIKGQRGNGTEKRNWK